MGFLRYVEATRKTSRGRLFPDIKPMKKGKVSGNWSKWWGRYARSNNVNIKAPGKVFHSFRHAFRDRCREAELDEEIAEKLSGRGSKTIGRGYGAGFSLRRLHAAISRIRYPDVTFPIMDFDSE